MKKITTLIVLLISVLLLVNCNKDDSNEREMANSIVGVWKLVEEYTDGAAVSLNNCALKETYIFGAEQFTHEVYAAASRKFGKFSGDDNDDNDDSDDDDKTDDDDDDYTYPTTDTPTTDSPSDDNDDNNDDDDDDYNTGGDCIMDKQSIGFWSVLENNYTLTVDGKAENHVIRFTDASNRFYFEKNVTINGVVKVKRYVYQRQ